jgi:GPI mannosyltransferase 3
MKKILFINTLLFGIVLRCCAAIFSQGTHHPDEHQQYLEQANRLAFGYGVSFWEQKRGMRNELYPGFLAVLLIVAELLGLHDPLVQAALSRFILATAILSVMYWYAWRWHRKGHTIAAIAFLALAAISPDMLYVNTRFLSENAAMVPLFLALICLERSPLLAGLWFALMFAIRFQSVFLIIGYLALALGDEFREKKPSNSIRESLWKCRSSRLLIGLCLGLIAMGGYDRWSLGEWFRSPVQYFHANIVENAGTKWGTEPWYRYLDWAGNALIQSSVFALPLLFLGAISQWRLALPSILFLACHSLIDHKEFRFLWTALPLVLVLVAVGTEKILAHVGQLV